MNKPTLRPAKQGKEYIPLHDFASHIPVLAREAANGNGDILELGCGFYSTPMLEAIAAARRRNLYVVTEKNEWAKMMRKFTNTIWAYFVSFDDLERVRGFLDHYSTVLNIDTVFMDFERAPKDRRPVLDLLLEFFPRVVVHDANWVPLDGLNAEIDRTLHPWTAIVTK